MKKIIYHGSINIVKEPIYGYGKKYNDYGLGFYCTENIELAKEWAVNKDKDGYVNIYELDINDLKILNLNDKRYNVLHWLTILLKNREFDLRSSVSQKAKEYLIKNYSIDISDIDVIIGYRADDSYFTFAQDFLNNIISLRKLTQKELSILSNVPLRTIQQYEQGNKDLDKANVTYLVNLSRVLNCSIEDIL